MNAQISFLEGSFSLIHIPLPLYTTFLQPILRVLLPQTCSDNTTPAASKGLTADDQHVFLNVSVTPIECSIVCHKFWAETVFEPAIRRALSTSSRNLPDITISKDSYAIFSVISAGMDAGSRVVDLTSPLALAKIPIFFITTYYSDFVLVPTNHRHRVVKTLLARGFVFADDDNKTDIGELQLRTFELLIKRSVVPYVDGPLRLVSCSGRERPESSMLALRGYGNYPGRPETRRRDTHDGAIPRRAAWVDKADTKLYAGAVSALVAQPRFLSITLTLEDPPSLLLDRALLELFGDSLVGPTEGTLVPIFLDLDTLPFEATGIVSGVAGKLVQEMQMAESAELSYLSTARAGAVILSEEQAAKALVILKGALKG